MASSTLKERPSAAGPQTTAAPQSNAPRPQPPRFSYPEELAPESELPPAPAPSSPLHTPRQSLLAAAHQMARSQHQQHQARAPAQSPRCPLDSNVWRPQTVPSERPNRTPTTTTRPNGATVAAGRGGVRWTKERAADSDRRTVERLMTDWDPSARDIWRRLDSLQDGVLEERRKERVEAKQQHVLNAAAALVAEAKRRVQEERARNQALKAQALQRRPPPSQGALDAWMTREETRLSELEYLAELRAQKLLDDADVSAGGGRRLLTLGGRNPRRQRRVSPARRRKRDATKDAAAATGKEAAGGGGGDDGATAAASGPPGPPFVPRKKSSSPLPKKRSPLPPESPRRKKKKKTAMTLPPKTSQHSHDSQDDETFPKRPLRDLI